MFEESPPPESITTGRICIICGRSLGGFLEEPPHWDAGPMCAECHRNRELDNDIWYSQMRAQLDAEADGDEQDDAGSTLFGYGLQDEEDADNLMFDEEL